MAIVEGQRIILTQMNFFWSNEDRSLMQALKCRTVQTENATRAVQLSLQESSYDTIFYLLDNRQ